MKGGAELKIKIGDMFKDDAKTLVNTVNCVGVMGKGIALEFKRRYPQMYKEYMDLCKNEQIKPGKPYYYTDLLGNSIINFPTKDHWNSPSRLSYIVAGLEWFVESYESLGIQSIAFPPLGCGNGGLSWEVVGPIMYKYLSKLPISVTIYAPYGTKTEYLTEEYLSQSREQTSDIKGTKSIQVNPSWMLILQAVTELNKSKYSLHVGRVIFQKICYVVTRLGVNTGFSFSKGSYGPYSREVKDAIIALSNANYIAEHPYQRMIVTYVNPKFKLEIDKYSNEDISRMNQTIDLFSRIKASNQAEIITTTMFSADTLKKSGKIPTEEDIYSFVVDWKPKWEDEHAEKIKETIRELASTRWIEAEYSEGFFVNDDA